MSKKISINKKYRIKSRILAGYVANCSCANMGDNFLGEYVLLDVDDKCRIMLNPKDVEIVEEKVFTQLSIEDILLGK